MSSASKSKKKDGKALRPSSSAEHKAKPLQPLIVRPLDEPEDALDKVYVALETLRDQGINAGVFVQLAGTQIRGVATPLQTSTDFDVVQIPRLIRVHANLCFGDRVFLVKSSRPKTAGSVVVVGNVTPAKAAERLRAAGIVYAGLHLEAFAVLRCYEAGQPDMNALSLAEKNVELEPFLVAADIQVLIDEDALDPPRRGVTYRDIGGLERELHTLRHKLNLPLLRPELFERFHTAPERGFLLFGPPGSGKTLLLKAIANETETHVVRVDGPAIFSKYMGETEQKLRDIFAEAHRFAPSIVFIDEIEVLAPRRDGQDSGEAEGRVVATLLTLMDGMSTNSRVIVVGATNRPNQIDPSLRRPGRLGQEIEVGIPDVAGRREILDLHLKYAPHHLSVADLDNIAVRTHGYVGADLQALCREAVTRTIEFGLSAGLDAESMFVTKEQFEQALTTVRPSAMREIALGTPKVYWGDIGGQDTTIRQLREMVEWPITHSEIFARLGVIPPRGVLLYGPPGCSKTLLAKALATEAGLNFLSVKGPELFNKYVGESERAIRELFRKAQSAAPSIIFFDEIDALSMARGNGEAGGDRVLTTLLTELDGIESLKSVITLAATNRPDVIDPALMRPGRLDRLIYVGPPDYEARRRILLIQFSKMAMDESIDVEALAELTAGFSGAEIVSACQEAGFLAMNEDIGAKVILQKHVEAALSGVHKTITPEMLQYFNDFRTGRT